MTGGEATAYEQLAGLTERALELVGDGRLEEAAELAGARAALIAGLPARPPESAGPALERAALLERRLNIELLRAREALLRELTEVERARRMAAGYAPVRRAGARVQLRA